MTDHSARRSKALGALGTALFVLAMAYPSILGIGLHRWNDYALVTLFAMLVGSMVGSGRGTVTSRKLAVMSAFVIIVVCASMAVVAFGSPFWRDLGPPILSLLAVPAFVVYAFRCGESSVIPAHLAILGFLFALNGERLTSAAYWNRVGNAPGTIVACWIAALVGGCLMGLFARARHRRQEEAMWSAGEQPVGG